MSTNFLIWLFLCPSFLLHRWFCFWACQSAPSSGPDGSILWTFREWIMLRRKSWSSSAKSAGTFCEALVPDRMPTPKRRFQHRSHIGEALNRSVIPIPPAISLARRSSILLVTTHPSDLSSSRKSNTAGSSSGDTDGLPG